MAAIWPGSRVPNFGIGDKLYFYDTATSTPQAVYSDGALSVARDQPIRADARGMFPVIYLSPTPGSIGCDGVFLAKGLEVAALASDIGVVPLPEVLAIIAMQHLVEACMAKRKQFVTPADIARSSPTPTMC